MNNLNKKSKKLNEILNWLSNNNMEYALVGEKPTRLLNSFDNDVDLAVSKDAYVRINQTIQNLCKETDIRLVILYRHEIDVFDFIVVWEEDGKVHNLPIDLCVDYRRKGIKYIDSQTLLSTKKQDKDTKWFTLNNETNFLYYLIKKIGKRSIDNTQILFLHELYNQSNKEIVKSLISKYWGTNDQEHIIKTILNKDINSFNAKSKIWSQIMASKGKCSFKEYFINLKRKISYLLEPRGIICSINENDLTFFNEYIKTTSEWFRKNQIIKLNQFTPLNVLRILNFKWHSGIVFVVQKNTNQCFFSDIKLDANQFQSLREHYTEIINFMENREKTRLERFKKKLK